MTSSKLEKKSKAIPFIGLASGIGGGNIESRLGPLTIQKEYPNARWIEMINPELSIKDKVEQIAFLNQKLAQTTFKASKNNPSIIVVGGDHSCAIGTWSGVSVAKKSQGKDLGLLWFDAHMDSHTLETSESGNPHGMPLASLLGHGATQFTHILSSEPKIKPENTFVIGIRSYEAPERQLLEKLNVKVYYIEEVLQRGLKAVITEIIDILAKKQIPYGISLDIDFFDPSIMSATGTPESPGPHPDEFIENTSLFKNYPPVAFEYVEFNPPFDQQGKSLEYTKKIIDAMTEILP